MSTNEAGTCAIRAVPAYQNLGKSISLCLSTGAFLIWWEPWGDALSAELCPAHTLQGCRACGCSEEAGACLLFSGSSCLRVFPEQSQLCCALHWARSETVWLSLAKSCSCSDLPFPLQSSWLQKGLWLREKTTVNEERKGQTDQVKVILLPA